MEDNSWRSQCYNLNFLNEGVFDDQINYIYIVLILKVKKPVKPSDYRPINLSNVIYKIVSKVLANRLKEILPKNISKSQSTYIPGRLITDNIIVAYKALHSMKSRHRGKEWEIELKLDISKAYDRIECACLEEMMRTLGFGEKWIAMTMTCVSTVRLSVLINGQLGVNLSQSEGSDKDILFSIFVSFVCRRA